MSKPTETLVEIRDLIARIHDRHLTAREPGLSIIELAALRDTCRRLIEVVDALAEAKP